MQGAIGRGRAIVNLKGTSPALSEGAAPAGLSPLLLCWNMGLLLFQTLIFQEKAEIWLFM